MKNNQEMRPMSNIHLFVYEMVMNIEDEWTNQNWDPNIETSLSIHRFQISLDRTVLWSMRQRAIEKHTNKPEHTYFSAININSNDKHEAMLDQQQPIFIENFMFEFHCSYGLAAHISFNDLATTLTIII